MSSRRRWGWPTLAAVLALAVGLVVIGAVLSDSAEQTATVTISTAPGAVSPATNPPGRPAPGGEQLGASVNYLFNAHDFTASQIAAQLRALKQTGVTIARSDAFWEASEPLAPVHGVHHFQWSFDDTVVGTLAQYGLQWLPILDYTAPWTQSIPGQDHSPPRSDADYAAYAGAFAARYGPGGAFWRSHPKLSAEPVKTYEIWNEPDNGQFWDPTPNAAQYAELYGLARDVIAAAQPEARVIVGGLMSPTKFLPAMLAARPQLRGHIDGIAIHPYGNPLVTLSKIRSARATIASLGLGPVPLYVTEFGWTTMPPGTVDYAPESARPRYLTATLAALGHLDCGLAAAILYTWVSPERDPHSGQDWYGINGVDGAPTQDVAAFEAGLRAARSARPTIKLCPS